MTGYCPMCDTENDPMGAFGSRHLHYRCRACGWTFSARQEPEDDREDLGAYADERDSQEA